MKRAVFPTTDEERDLEIEHDKVLLARVLKAMNEPDHFEHKKPSGIPLALVTWAAIICVVVAWVITARML